MLPKADIQHVVTSRHIYAFPVEARRSPGAHLRPWHDLEGVHLVEEVDIHACRLQVQPCRRRQDVAPTWQLLGAELTLDLSPAEYANNM